MKNVNVEVKGTIMTITVDLSKENGLSGSGKNMVIGTTSGNADVPGHEGTKFGLNVFKKPS